MKTLVIRQPNEDELNEVRELRYKVLDEPLKIKKATIEDVNDYFENVVHMAAFDGDKIVSCVRLDLYDKDIYLVRRMATDQSYQGKGIGRKVMIAAEDEARKRGTTKMILFSRKRAVGFYEKLGYINTGKLVKHEGAENIEMTKEIQ